MTASASTIAFDAAIETALGGDKDSATKVSSNTDEYVTVYSTVTGEAKSILKIDARRVLRKTLPGSAAPAHWMPGMPGEQPKRIGVGAFKCYLHPDFDEKDGPARMDRAWVDSVGLAGVTCNMGNPANHNRADFPSAIVRDRHMQRRHRDEWEVIKQSRELALQQADRDERRADREAIVALAGGRTRQKAVEA